MQQRFIETDDVIVGERSSRISSAIFVLLLGIPVFAAILYGAVDSAAWIFISIAWAAVVLLWLAESWRAGGFVINTSPLVLPLVGLLVIGVVQLVPLAAILSLDPYSTRSFILRLVIYVVFFAACLTFIHDERRLKKVVLTVIVFGAAMAFFGILQRLASPEGIYGIRPSPQAIPFGPFMNQHHFAAFVVMAGGVTLGLLVGKSTQRDKKLLLATAFVVMFVATILTSSRGGLLAMISAVAFVVLLNFRASAGAARGSKLGFIAAAIALVAITVGTVFFVGGGDALLRGVGLENANADLSTGRAHFWPIAIRIFLDHPILGAGLDAFGVAFTQYDTWNGALRVEQAHNDYLQILADAGVAGFICVAAFIFLLFRKGLRNIAAASGMPREAAVGALAGCLGILVHSFFDFPLRTHSNTFFFLLLAAIATLPVIIQDRKTRVT